MNHDLEPLDTGMGNTGLTLTSQDTANLRTAGKWGRFIAIVGFVFMGLGVIGMLFYGGFMLTMMGSNTIGGAGYGTITIALVLLVYLGFFALTIYLYYLIYRFGSQAVQAVESGSGAAMGESLKALKSMFKISGILIIVFIGLYALLFLVALVGGAAGFFL